MSFSGDLEHMPLVDVVQLLQQTSKSGTLRLTGAKGECQLGFRDGFIVSANHHNTCLRVGSVLVRLGIIGQEVVDRALAEQARRGPRRPPLISLLLEQGHLKREDAYRGLRSLIELTIVEVLTWPKGRFDLDVEQVVVSDEYRYFPDRKEPMPAVSTQSFLMEALRLFDEMKRDGSLQKGVFAADPDAAAEEETISADLLGLGDVETLVRKVPAKAVPEAPREDEQHRDKVRKELPDLSPQDQERLVAFFTAACAGQPAGEPQSAGGGCALAVILFTRDQLFSHAAMSCAAARGVFVFATDEPQNLVHIVEQSLSRDLTPLLVVDPAGDGAFSTESVAAILQSIRAGHPQLSFIRLVDPGQDAANIDALAAGAVTAIPKPRLNVRPASFVDDFIRFVGAFLACLQRVSVPPGLVQLGDFKERLAGLSSLSKPTEITLAMLQFAATFFPRALTLVVSGAEVVADRAIGLQEGRGVSPPLKLRFPVERPSALAAAIDGGLLFYGPCPEEPSLQRLHRQIGEPRNSKIMILPFRNSSGRVLALTYGDFGPAWARPVPIELLDVFARHAGLVFDGIARRPSG